MPRKSITSRKEEPKPPSQPEPQEPGLSVLFIEEGDDEFTRFKESLRGSIDLIHVSTGRQASARLIEDPDIDIAYVTMQFPSAIEEDLVGMEDALVDRFSGNLEKASRFARENQGLFILHHIRKQIEKPTPVLVSHDFSTELQRWDTMTSRYEKVYYVREGMSPIDIADLMQTIVERNRDETI